MGNDQTVTNLFNPIILYVSAGANQTQIALTFIQEQLNWEIKPNSPQLQLINQAHETITIETIRDLISELAYAPHLGKARAFVFLAADQLSVAAQHAFLKSLEEPPVDTLILLVTQAPNQLLPTIRSRCIVHQLQTTSISLDSAELPKLLPELVQQPSLVAYHQLIDLLADYKDRERALNLCRQFLYYLRQSPTDIYHNTFIQQQLLKTIDQLQTNANVRLAMESCFFTIKEI